MSISCAKNKKIAIENQGQVNHYGKYNNQERGHANTLILSTLNLLSGAEQDELGMKSGWKSGWGNVNVIWSNEPNLRKEGAVVSWHEQVWRRGGSASTGVTKCGKEGTCIYSLFDKKTSMEEREKGQGSCMCADVKRLVHCMDTNPEWSRGYSWASLRPITTYKMVSGGVSTQ